MAFPFQVLLLAFSYNERINILELVFFFFFFFFSFFFRKEKYREYRDSGTSTRGNKTAVAFAFQVLFLAFQYNERIYILGTRSLFV